MSLLHAKLWSCIKISNLITIHLQCLKFTSVKERLWRSCARQVSSKETAESESNTTWRATRTAGEIPASSQPRSCTGRVQNICEIFIEITEGWLSFCKCCTIDLMKFAFVRLGWPMVNEFVRDYMGLQNEGIPQVPLVLTCFSLTLIRRVTMSMKKTLSWISIWWMARNFKWISEIQTQLIM